MKTKQILVASFLMAGITCNTLSAQNRARTHNLVFNVDFCSSHIYTTAVTSIFSGLLNSATNSDVFGSSYRWNFYNATTTAGSELEVQEFLFNGMSAEDLFRDFQPGIEIGYQTYNPSAFNCGFSVSGHYAINQFKIEDALTKQFNKHNIHRLLTGAAVFVTLGEMQNPMRVTIEAGVRYSKSLSYNNPMNLPDDYIQDGWTSHYAVTFAGKTFFQDFGAFLDINHFSLFNNNLETSVGGMKLNRWALGITWKVNWKQSGELRY